VTSNHKRFNPFSLDAMNFLLADVRGALGPYLNTLANGLMAIVGDVFGPAVAALTLGLYARNQLARRMGRNAAFDHAGNVAIAVLAGAVGFAFSQRAVFLLVFPKEATAMISACIVAARLVMLPIASCKRGFVNPTATNARPSCFSSFPFQKSGRQALPA
jgi:hypothetical protein